jgi:hypothetical protein
MPLPTRCVWGADTSAVMNRSIFWLDCSAMRSVGNEHELISLSVELPLDQHSWPCSGAEVFPIAPALCRFLAAVDRPCLEALRTLARAAERGLRVDHRNHWRYLRVAWVAASWSLTSMPPARQGDLEPCLLPLNCLPLDADSMPSVRLVRQGASAVRWSEHAPRRAEMHTRQWIGTYAGTGNGDSRGELASARHSITTYLKQFAFSSEMALARLDGQYGNAAVVAQTHACPYSCRDARQRLSTDYEHPQLRRVLAR